MLVLKTVHLKGILLRSAISVSSSDLIKVSHFIWETTIKFIFWHVIYNALMLLFLLFHFIKLNQFIVMQDIYYKDLVLFYMYYLILSWQIRHIKNKGLMKASSKYMKDSESLLDLYVKKEVTIRINVSKNICCNTYIIAQKSYNYRTKHMKIAFLQIHRLKSLNVIYIPCFHCAWYML